MRGPAGCLGGCLTKLLLWAVVATVFVWAFTVVLNPWALHIGDRPTPLLYWHGTGTVTAEDGRSYPLYLFFGPGRPGGFHGAGRRQGKSVSANLTGTAWLCLAPGNVERMKLSGTMYGGYTSMRESLIDFRLLEWGKSFSIDYQSRGFFDLAGTWHGQEPGDGRPWRAGHPPAFGSVHSSRDSEAPLGNLCGLRSRVPGPRVRR